MGLDGCFLKGSVSGQILCAIGRDANNQMYPVAWAVVEKETSESWEWFVGLLIKDLDINDQGEGWVFISDQQKVCCSHSCPYWLFVNYLLVSDILLITSLFRFMLCWLGSLVLSKHDVLTFMVGCLGSLSLMKRDLLTFMVGCLGSIA